MTTSRSSSWLEVVPSHMLANQDAFHEQIYGRGPLFDVNYCDAGCWFLASILVF